MHYKWVEVITIKKYDIEIVERSYIYRTSYCGNYGVYVMQEENYLDTDREVYYFTTDYTKEIYGDSINKYINRYLLEVLNGIKICLGEIPLEVDKLDNFDIEKQIEAYEIINCTKYNIRYNQIIESDGDKLLKIALTSQNIRDIFVLLNRVNKLDEHTFVNMYKIDDTAKSLITITKDLPNIDTSKLRSQRKRLSKHNAIANNYLNSGLIARHGNMLWEPGKSTLSKEALFKDTLKVVREIMNIFLNNPHLNFDVLVNKHLLTNRLKKCT